VATIVDNPIMIASSESQPLPIEKHLVGLPGDLKAEYQMGQVLELGDGTWMLLIQRKRGGSATVLLQISKDGNECISAVHDERIQCIGRIDDNTIAIAVKGESQKSHIELTSIVGGVSVSLGTICGYETCVRSMARLKRNPNVLITYEEGEDDEGEEHCLRLWSIENRSCFRTISLPLRRSSFDKHQFPPSPFCELREDGVLVLACNSELQLWDIAAGSTQHRIALNLNGVINNIIEVASGVVAINSGVVQLYDVRNRTSPNVFKGEPATTVVSFDFDNGLFITDTPYQSYAPYCVKGWNLKGERWLELMVPQFDYFMFVTSDRRLLVSSGLNAQLFDIRRRFVFNHFCIQLIDSLPIYLSDDTAHSTLFELCCIAVSKHYSESQFRKLPLPTEAMDLCLIYKGVYPSDDQTEETTHENHNKRMKKQKEIRGECVTQ